MSPGSTKEEYDAFYSEKEFFHYPAKVDTAFFRSIFDKYGIRQGETLLDVGCGDGVRTARMQALGVQATGLDYSMTGLRKAKNYGLQHWVKGDANRMPFAKSVFDAVISLGCSLLNTDSVQGITDAIQEMLRVVRPGRWVFAVTTTNYSRQSDSVWYNLGRAQLEEAARRTDSANTAIHYTAPGIASKFPGLLFHPLINFIFKYIPGYTRTVVIACQAHTRPGYDHLNHVRSQR